jgi:UDP-N-acetylmuramate dehydrogenase
MEALKDLAEIIKREEPLAPYTYFKLGGPAEMLIQPRSVEELAAVVTKCSQLSVPMRVLGGGCGVLVRDEGVRGAVLRLHEPVFTSITVEGRRVRAGAGAALSALISQGARFGLAGLEGLVGIPGTVGGAIRCNTGDRSGDIGQYVRSVQVLDRHGKVLTREEDEIHFVPGGSNLDDAVILSAEFELEADRLEAIDKRIRRAWIQRKAAQPPTFQAAGRIFKNPRGFIAAALIEGAGLAKTRVGGAEVNERDANFIVAHPGTSTRDVLRLIDLVRSRVRERYNVDLELEIVIW